MSPSRRSIAAIRAAPRAAPARLGSGTCASKPGTPSWVALNGSVECTTSKNSPPSRASRAAASARAAATPGVAVTSRGSAIFRLTFTGMN